MGCKALQVQRLLRVALGKILALKKECVFEWGYLVESEVRTVGGKEKRFQKKTPLSYVLAPTADNGGGGQG